MKRILVVDDSAMMRKWISDILQSDPELEVVAEAKDGLDAIELFNIYSPDIVILDLIMKDVDGITALKEILQINPNTKVIICTALGTNFNREEVLHLGAKDIVIKPYFDDLIKKVKSIKS
jgi:two-component system, chemotaxis family, chemotaxis protein CheY